MMFMPRLPDMGPGGPPSPISAFLAVDEVRGQPVIEVWYHKCPGLNAGSQKCKEQPPKKNHPEATRGSQVLLWRVQLFSLASGAEGPAGEMPLPCGCLSLLNPKSTLPGTRTQRDLGCCFLVFVCFVFVFHDYHLHPIKLYCELEDGRIF